MGAELNGSNTASVATNSDSSQNEYSLRSPLRPSDSISATHSSGLKGGSCLVFLLRLCLCHSLLKCSLYCFTSPTTASHVLHLFCFICSSSFLPSSEILLITNFTTGSDVAVGINAENIHCARNPDRHVAANQQPALNTRLNTKQPAPEDEEARRCLLGNNKFN